MRAGRAEHSRSTGLLALHGLQFQFTLRTLARIVAEGPRLQLHNVEGRWSWFVVTHNVRLEALEVLRVWGGAEQGLLSLCTVVMPLVLAFEAPDLNVVREKPSQINQRNPGLVALPQSV